MLLFLSGVMAGMALMGLLVGAWMWGIAEALSVQEDDYDPFRH